MSISLGKVELFCLFVACSYTSMEATVLCRFCPARPKFPEITNHQYLWKGLSHFVHFLHVAICISMDIHISYQNLLLWAGIVRHSLWANQIARWFKLKNLKTWFFASIEATKISCYLDYAAKYSWPISLQDFYFWLVWLVNVHTGGPSLQCTYTLCLFWPKSYVKLFTNITKKVILISVTNLALFFHSRNIWHVITI